MKIKKKVVDDPKALVIVKQEKTCRLTVDINADVHSKLKSKCALEGKKMNEIVEHLIKGWID